MKVKITPEDSLKVESLHYGYNARKDLFASLIQSGIETSSGPGKEFYDETTAMFTRLEKTKQEISQKYLPEGFDISTVNFTFQFDSNEIEYKL